MKQSTWLNLCGLGALGAALISCGGKAKPTAAPRADSIEGRAASSADEARIELEAERIKFGLISSESEIRQCFGDGSGRVTLAWTMAGSGAVSEVSLLDVQGDGESVAQCVADIVETSSFSTGGRAAVAQWSFVVGMPDYPSDRAGASKKRKRKYGTTRHDDGPLIEANSPGRLDAGVIESTTMGAFSVFSHCFRAGLERTPSLSGSIRLRLIVLEDGSVGEVLNAESEVEDRALLDCAAEGFYSLRYPQPVGGPLHVKYTLLLNVE